MKSRIIVNLEPHSVHVVITRTLAGQRLPQVVSIVLTHAEAVTLADKLNEVLDDPTD